MFIEEGVMNFWTMWACIGILFTQVLQVGLLLYLVKKRKVEKPKESVDEVDKYLESEFLE